MPNYGRERLNSRFTITTHRTQYSKLKNFNDNTYLKNTRLRGFMRNYGHELLTQGLKDTSHLKTIRLIGFMRNYEHELLNSRTSWLWSSCGIYGHERLDSGVYITTRNSCNRLFSFSCLLPQNLVQIDN
ncbi:hypothetical protein MTR67_017262 [Solanum verrucosum]|uniref:Uncharacterized protein n=1 Tax=Solanum verrucosum TaxID=315347 RepID=A0AAF0QHM7_SOLVR|nr:hypothetical protein MTR67_017262 [Solanum verrucosum]